ncbi:hypothetical protein ACM66B_005519 [Microbotryomycetes sp. NB124-2]
MSATPSISNGTSSPSSHQLPPPPPQSTSQYSSSSNGSANATRPKHARVASTSEHWNDLPDYAGHSSYPSAPSRSPNAPQPRPSQHRRAASLATPSPQPSPTNGRVLELVREEEGEYEEDESSNAQDTGLAHRGTTRLATEPQPAHKHARGHSRIHERNLSAFFPRPGQAAVGYGDAFEDPHRSRDRQTSPIQSMPEASTSPDKHTPTRQLGRRGHHHRHSVSHNYFSFLDNQAANSPPAQSLSSKSALHPSTNLDRFGSPNRSSLAQRILRLPLRSRLTLLAALLQFIIGSSLWVSGQNRESLAVTSLGYFVVFDGLGALGTVLVDGTPRAAGLLRTSSEQTLRRPFGGQRLGTLSHFSQAIYLLFSAVYVCKESVEHVLLLHGASEDEGAHGSGHGGMGHGDAAFGSSGQSLDGGVTYPIWLLSAASALSLFMSLAVSSHRQLASSVHENASSSRSQNPSTRLGNQFSWSVIGLSLFLAMCGLSVPRYARLRPGFLFLPKY